MKAEDQKTGIAMRLVKKWDIEADRRPTYDAARALFPLKGCTVCEDLYYTNAADPFVCRDCQEKEPT